MKFYDRTLNNGQRVLLVDLTDTGKIQLSALADALTTGYTSSDIGAFNGVFGEMAEPVSGTWAIPVAWLNDAGRLYLSNATKAAGAIVSDSGGTRIDITGGRSVEGLTPLQLGLILVAAGLAISAFTR